MEGLKELYELPIEKRNAIAETFESVENLYEKVFELHKKDYLLQKNKPNGYQALQAQYQSELNEIEDVLDEMELDGHSIITEISSDHGEIIVNKVVTNLDNYLKQKGTSFEQMREWLKRQIGE